MSDDQYVPTQRFDNTGTLLTNHFRFDVEALPDLSFYVTAVTLPTLSVPPLQTVTPFSDIPDTGGKVNFGALDVNFTIDGSFKNYHSLWWWIRGGACPTDFTEYTDFAATRRRALPQARPSPREILKTKAVLTILQPDTDRGIAEVAFTDVFPTVLGSVSFATGTAGDAHTTVGFRYTDLTVRLLPS